MINGQDWSSYQSATPSTAGLAFVFVKRTEGLDYVNPKAPTQVAHGRAGGLTIGHYHYPKIANSASAEADRFLEEVGGDLHAGDMLALDWEWYGQSVTAAQARAYKGAFLARLKLRAPGHRVGLYVDRSNWTTVDTDSDCGDFLWIADVTTAGKPRIEHPWTFHQFSSSGGIDHDVANFPNAAALRTWATGAATTSTSAKETDMQLSDQIPLGAWIPAAWPTDKGLADKRIEVGTALGSGYAHARATHDATTAILAQLKTLTAQQGALSAAVAALAKGGGLTAEQITAAAQAGAAAALAELGHTLTTQTTTNS